MLVSAFHTQYITRYRVKMSRVLGWIFWMWKKLSGSIYCLTRWKKHTILHIMHMVTNLLSRTKATLTTHPFLQLCKGQPKHGKKVHIQYAKVVRTYSTPPCTSKDTENWTEAPIVQCPLSYFEFNWEKTCCLKVVYFYGELPLALTWLYLEKKPKCTELSHVTTQAPPTPE